MFKNNFLTFAVFPDSAGNGHSRCHFEPVEKRASASVSNVFIRIKLNRFFIHLNKNVRSSNIGRRTFFQKQKFLLHFHQFRIHFFAQRFYTFIGNVFIVCHAFINDTGWCKLNDAVGNSLYKLMVMRSK